MGEACTAANRFFVHRSVVEEFSEKFSNTMSELQVGNGVLAGTDVGPLIDQGGLDKVDSLVTDALNKGARILTGGTRPEGPGYFYTPTVLVDVPTDAALMTTEIFGPVVAITPFDSEDEVLAQANDTDWGLIGYVFTESMDKAMRFSAELEVGMVGLNTGLVSNPAAPFGGVKQSGLGREGGKVGIEEFLEIKYTALAVNDHRVCALNEGMPMAAPEGLFVLEGRPTAQLIADQLREQIVQGSIRPGQQINESLLASQLNTSKGPLREALQRLCQEGILISRRNYGVFVLEVETHDLREIYERFVSPSNPPTPAGCWRAA
jgi:Aldehyde dehydrogenase family/Bacterial regulatory proteins, gntR family